ncbi:MAG: adenylate/guanylate cyclase domain-containing protein [Chloroflexi bacterium]|nr:adenylate/guanylate cyclase domain-containing protein [Chloroflexota bacterium]
MSDRDVADLSVEGRLLDLDAVIGRLGFESVNLFAWGNAGSVAITYAVRQPKRVDHLILQDCFVDAASYYEIPEFMGLLALLQSDWDTFTETLSNIFFGWRAGEPARRGAAFLRECVTAEGARAAMAAVVSSDVTSVVSDVRSPTMVIHPRESKFPGIETARSLAASIPNASLRMVDGAWITTDDLAVASVSAIYDFLGLDRPAIVPTTPTPSMDAVVHTILFTDVEGSTALTERLGDAKARDLLREHERITREALAAHGGSEVKTMGDGFMTSFGSAVKALECAIAIQQSFAEHNASAEDPIRVRIGLNAGEPIAEDDPSGRGDLFGTAVNLAARVAAKAEGGEILVADVVRQLVAGKKFLLNDRGETELRGFEDPVRLYEVRWGERSG